MGRRKPAVKSVGTDEDALQNKSSPTQASPPYRQKRTRSSHSISPPPRTRIRRFQRKTTAPPPPPLPPPEDLLALESIFRDKIHPIFPLLGDDHGRDESDNSAPTGSVLSRQVIALAAALDPVAAPHLRLETNGPVLPLGDFHGRLAAAVIAALDDDMVADPVDLTPIKVLFALFYQPANASERERVARLCGQAVRHFNGNRPLQRREGGNGYYIDEPPPHRGGGSHGNRYRLFCAIWALERLCFAFYAQTSLMHEGEGDRSLDSCIRKQPPGFQLFMRVVQALDSFIAPRRPRQPFRPIEMPGFEDMILDAGAEGLPITILATIEMLYHATVVLSYRQPSGAFSDNRAPDDLSYIQRATVDARRSLSASSIVWLAQHHTISAFPFVPYAVSLALSVQWREVRESQTAMFRIRAQATFGEIVCILKGMSDMYVSARVNAGLGAGILKEMERTAGPLRGDAANGPPAQTPADAADGAATVSSAGIRSIPDEEAVSASRIAYPEQPLPPLGSLDVSLLLSNHGMDTDLFGYFNPNFDSNAVGTVIEMNMDTEIRQH